MWMLLYDFRIFLCHLGYYEHIKIIKTIWSKPNFTTKVLRILKLLHILKFYYQPFIIFFL